MQWIDIERAFSKSLLVSFSRKKLILTVPLLFVAGLFAIFCEAVTYGSGSWASMSLGLLPLFVTLAILLPLGILLIQVQEHEMKGNSFSLLGLLGSSFESILSSSYIGLIPIVAYLSIWVLMGVFFLLTEIPVLGGLISVFFAFMPFLLIALSLILFLSNLALLFFFPPIHSVQPKKEILKRIGSVFLPRPLTSIFLMILALLPMAFVGILIGTAAVWTHAAVASDSVFVSSLIWFFIMLPSVVLLAPTVLFFFNFSAASSQLLKMNVECR